MSEDCLSSININNNSLDDDKLYPVEKIVGKRSKRGKVEYLVRWKNYSSDNDSWEKSKDIAKSCYPLIKQYNDVHKLVNNNNSIPTSTESSSDTPISNNKDNDKILNNELNLFEKHTKFTNITSKLKWNPDHNLIKNRSKENVKYSNLSPKPVSDNSEKCCHIISPKVQNGSENIENSNTLIRVSSKESFNGNKSIVQTDLNNKLSEICKLSDNNNLKSQKKVLYLENNEIDEPYVSKSKPINGIISHEIVKTKSLSTTPPLKTIEIVNTKPDLYKFMPAEIANHLKRKSVPIVISNQKKSKLLDKDSKVNLISVIANNQIRNLNNIISFDSGNKNDFITNRYCKLTPMINSQLMSDKKIDKCFRNLPHQRYNNNNNNKESEHTDNIDSTENRRTSVRQIEAANRFQEIIVRKNTDAGFTEICLQNNPHLFPNRFNIKILNELQYALKQAINDSSRVILLSSTGNVFSSGIDLESIISSSQKCVPNVKTVITTTAQLTTPQHPNQQIHDLAESLKKFLLELLHFPKPIVVGINGPAIGLGCAILPLCDLIYATESSSFCLPYTTLSQIPEAGSSLTLPILVGMPTANQLLLCGRKWSAKEALNKGLISEVIFSEKFRAELLCRCEKLAHVPSMSSETMKCMLRIHYKEQIDLTINMECRKLIEIWKTNEFRNSAQHFLANELPNLLL